MSRTWQDNAAEFAALTKQGKDVRLALLVACSVERGIGQGEREPCDDRRKVSAREFGRRASATDRRVMRHLDAWDRLAARGLVRSADELSPEDVATYEIPDEAISQFEHGDVFDATKSGGRPRASVTEIAKAMDDRPEIVEEVIRNVASSTAAQIADTPSIRAASAALPKPATEHRQRMAEAARAADDGRSREPQMVTALQHLIDAEQMEALVSRLVEQMRAGLMDRMPPDVKDEAIQQFRRWVNAFEWAITIIEGGSITDEALATWLASEQ